MSLIIEGMNIPEYRDVFGDERGCVYLLMLTVNKDGTASMQFNDVDGGFHRVKEIRTPHGRLIDADRFLGWIEEFHPNDVAIISGVKNARTVIEAEVSE